MIRKIFTARLGKTCDPVAGSKILAARFATAQAGKRAA